VHSLGVETLELCHIDHVWSCSMDPSLFSTHPWFGERVLW